MGLSHPDQPHMAISGTQRVRTGRIVFLSCLRMILTVAGHAIKEVVHEAAKVADGDGRLGNRRGMVECNISYCERWRMKKAQCPKIEGPRRYDESGV